MANQKNTGLWVATGLVTFVFLTASIPKLLLAKVWLFRFIVWGYPKWFVIVIGALELAGAVAILFRRTAFWGAALLSAIMVGAFFTHFKARDGIAMFGPILVLALLWYILQKRKPRNLRFWKSRGSATK